MENALSSCIYFIENCNKKNVYYGFDKTESFCMTNKIEMNYINKEIINGFHFFDHATNSCLCLTIIINTKCYLFDITNYLECVECCRMNKNTNERYLIFDKKIYNNIVLCDEHKKFKDLVNKLNISIVFSYNERKLSVNTY